MSAMLRRLPGENITLSRLPFIDGRKCQVIIDPDTADVAIPQGKGEAVPFIQKPLSRNKIAFKLQEVLRNT